VTEVWPDGAIVTVDGDSGPGRDGWLSVTINGPYASRRDSLSYNGFIVGIYAFAQPKWFDLGQYPNLGVVDAFIDVRHGGSQHIVRASAPLGDRAGRHP
jgi:hypothetical protein